MTKKYCINCTFLCHHENGSPVSCTENIRNGKTKYPGIGLDCFRDEWRRKKDSDLARYMRYITYFSVPKKGIVVEGANGRPIYMSSYYCKLHHPFDAASSKPLETIKEEEDERRKEKKEDRKFWIKTVVAIIATTIATIILAI